MSTFQRLGILAIGVFWAILLHTLFAMRKKSRVAKTLIDVLLRPAASKGDGVILVWALIADFFVVGLAYSWLILKR